MIKLISVYKSFPTKQGAKIILDNADFEIHKGEKIGILGKNGSGKTTLTRMLAGVVSPDSGRIIREMKVSWPVGYNGGFATQLTGMDNIKFISKIYNEDYEQVADYVEEFADIGEFLNEPMNTYSSGMRARLNFGLMMAINFDCYLIDELLAVGDKSFRAKCHSELFKKKADRGMVIVSHNDRLIQQYCTKAAVFHERKIIAFDETVDAIKFYNSIP
jgi:capsular polysaccharide transport system ATP-binding protein